MSVPKIATHGDQVIEDGQPIGNYWTAENAKRVAAFMRAEHAEGRKPQASCPNGPCDWDRIVDLARYARSSGRPVILCPDHQRRLDEARRLEEARRG